MIKIEQIIVETRQNTSMDTRKNLDAHAYLYHCLNASVSTFLRLLGLRHPT